MQFDTIWKCLIKKGPCFRSNILTFLRGFHQIFAFLVSLFCITKVLLFVIEELNLDCPFRCFKVRNELKENLMFLLLVA